jgi:hypothetical protein
MFNKQVGKYIHCVTVLVHFLLWLFVNANLWFGCETLINVSILLIIPHLMVLTKRKFSPYLSN